MTIKEIPERLKNIPTDTFEAFLNYFGFDEVSFKDYYSADIYAFKGNAAIKTNIRRVSVPLNLSLHDGSNNLIAFYFDEMDCWYSTLNIYADIGRLGNVYSYYIKGLELREIGEWKPCQKVVAKSYNEIMLNPLNELEDILNRHYPYWLKYLKDANFSLENYRLFMQFPELEILCKAGYKFAEDLCTATGYRSGFNSEGTIAKFNTLCKHGNNPAEILQISKAAADVLKNESSLSIWDSFRKMDKFKRMSPDGIRTCVAAGYTEKDVRHMADILKRTYNGKPVFSFASLVAYLDRVDMYEAIEREEACQLLSDYLAMCQQLNIAPRIDGDSLKREHDVTARTLRNIRNEVKAEKMNNACNFRDWDYSEEIYFVRSIESYDDLISEAKMQHNCVASYADRIINGTSRIYVMRLKSAPETSLITIELSPDGSTIRQKLLAYNRPIRNRAQSEFIDRWLKFIRTQKAISSFSVKTNGQFSMFETA